MTTQVVCPQCNKPAEIAPGEHPFCRFCDYPLFWVMPRPRTVAEGAESEPEQPRTVGPTCIVCRTPNDATRSLCRACGQPLAIVTPRQRRSWELPLLEERTRSRWRRFLLPAVVVLLVIAMIAVVAWAVWTYLWPRSEWQVSVLDQGEASWDIAATLERGSPVISYVDASDFTLRVVICGNPFCDSSQDSNLHTTITVIGQGGQGAGTAVGVGADGRPVVAYRDGARGALMVAHCGDPTCADPGAIALTEVDPGAAVLDPSIDLGHQPSMAIGRDGLPIIAYHDRGRGALRVAHCENPSCSVASVSVLDRKARASADAEGVGTSPSIRIASDGLPVIAFRDGEENALKVARCSDERCTQAVIRTMVQEAGRNPGHDASLILAPDGTPVVAYTDWADDGVYLAKCEQLACERVSVRRLDRSEEGASSDAVLAVDREGLPVIAFRQREPGDERASRILKVVRCGDIACTDASAPEVIDDRGRTGYTPSMLLLQDGTLAIAYGDATQGALEYAVYR